MPSHTETKVFLDWVVIRGIWGKKEERNALRFYKLANGINLVHCTAIEDDDLVGSSSLLATMDLSDSTKRKGKCTRSCIIKPRISAPSTEPGTTRTASYPLRERAATKLPVHEVWMYHCSLTGWSTAIMPINCLVIFACYTDEDKLR